MNDKTIRHNGKIATLGTAKQRHRCDGGCHLDILPGHHYFSVVLGGSGVRMLRNPWRVCVVDIREFMEAKR